MLEGEKLEFPQIDSFQNILHQGLVDVHLLLSRILRMFLKNYFQNTVLHSSDLHTMDVDLKEISVSQASSFTSSKTYLVQDPNFLSSKEIFSPIQIVFSTHVEVKLQIPVKVNNKLGIHRLLNPLFIYIGLYKYVNPYFELIYRARLVPSQCV